MLFLVQYDRRSSSLRTLKQYFDYQQSEADEARLNLELRLIAEGIEDEVVLLDAEDINALVKTHRRYFENVSQLTEEAINR